MAISPVHHANTYVPVQPTPPVAPVKRQDAPPAAPPKVKAATPAHVGKSLDIHA